MFSRRPRRLGLRSHRPANRLAIEGLSAAESLEMRRLMAVDIQLVGGVLTVSFDDTSDDAISLSINASGYSATGANVTSGTGTISQLIVTDAGTAKNSDLTLLQADQVLTGGLFIASNITAARIEDSINTSGGDISIAANCLTSFAGITIDSGAGNQTYAGPVTLLGDVTLNAPGGGNVDISGGMTSVVPGTSALTVDAGTAGAVTFSGASSTIAGNVSVTARNIVITADLVSTSGDISLTGDAGSTVSGVFHGVHINGSGVEVKTLATDLVAGATGAITVQGRGGDAVAAGSASQAFGVYLQAGAALSAGGSGDVNVTGIGGVSSTASFSSGVLVSNSNEANGVSEIVTVGGSIFVTGTAGGASGTDNNYGVSVNSFGRITAGGSGSVSVTGTATDTGGTGNSGVIVTNFIVASQNTPTAAIISSGGEITITGAGTASGAAVVLRNAGKVASGGSGNVTVIADSLEFDTSGWKSASPATIGSITAGAAGNATVTIQPSTAGTLIDLGGFDSLTSPLTLGLSTDEIDRITAGTLSVGSATAGVATVSIALTPANVTNLAIRSGAGVTLAGHITTDGGTITIDDGAGGDTAVTLANSALLDTTKSGATSAGAAVTVRGTVTSDTTNIPLQIQAGTDGDVLVTGTIGAVGAGQAPQSVIVVGNDISLAGIDGVVDNTYVEANDGTDTGSITLTGLTYATGAGFTLSAGPRDGFNVVSNPITLTGGTAGSNTTFTTAGNLIELSGAINLNGRNLAIDTTAGGANATGAPVFVNDAIDGAGTLSIDAGTGDAGSGGEVSVNHLSGAVGGTTPLTAVTLINAREASFGRAVNAGTLSLLDATENITVQGVMNLTSGLVTAAEPYNLAFLGGSAGTSVIAGATTFLNTGTLRLGDQGGDAFTFSGGVVATAPTSIVLSAAIGATTGVITLGDADTSVLSGGGAAIGGVSTGDITIGDLSFADGAGIILGTGIANAIEVGAISGTAGAGPETVEINTLGTVTVTGTIGGGLSSFTITNSGGTTFQDSVAAGSVAITDTTGTVTFQGVLTAQSLLTAAEPYAVAILADGSEIVNAAVFDNTGGVTIGNATADTITFTGGLMSEAGPTTLAGTVVTADAEARFGAVALAADSVINASSGNASFAGAIDGAHALTVQSTGLTSFGGAIGGTTPLASLTTDAGGTTTIAGGGVTTTGNQTYGDPVNLTADTVITAGGALSLGNLTATGNVTLTGLTVDVTGDIVSAGKLNEIQSTAGNITIAGGISADNLAGSAGFITVETLGIGNISIAGNLSAVGGNGGDGGLIGVYGNEAIALAGIDASGGDSATGAGGWAGWVTVASDDSVITVSGQIAANGGEAAGVSAAGGNGGIVSLVGNNSLISFGSVTIDGGSSANGLGGDGGALFAGNGTATGLLTMGGNLSARGGSGSTGGGAGGSLAILSPVNLSAALDLNTTSPGSADGNASLNRVDGPYAVTVAGGLELTGNLVVGGLSTSDATTVYGNLTIATGAGELTLAGGVSQPTGTTSILTLGDANQTGNVTIAGDTVVLHGLEIAAGDFDVSLNVANGSIQNPVSFLNNGTLTLEHVATSPTVLFTFAGGINASSVTQTILGGELFSSNAAVILHNLTTTTANAAIFTVGDSAGPGGPITIDGLSLNGNLTVESGDSDTTLSGNAVVNGAIGSFGNLVVPGNLTLAGLIAGVGTQTYSGSLTLTGDSTLDSTFTGLVPGSPIALAGAVETDGYQLTITTGDQPVEVLANLSANGSIDLPTNSLSVGNETTSATISSQGNLILTVGGTLGVTSGSAINVGPHDLTLRVNGLDVSANAAGLTAGLLTLAPATAGTNIFLGSATGTGLAVPESVFDAINASVVQVGEAGFNGTVTLGDLDLTASRLDIVADGVDGRVVQNGTFVSTATGTPGNIGLLVEGSGGTYVLNGSITSASDVVINDALEVSGGSWAIDTQATGANITITGGNANGSAGLYATLGELNSLTLNAGTGTIALGSSAGFGDASGTGSLLDNVDITGGQTLLSASTSTIGGGLTVNGPIDLLGDGAFSVTDTIAVGGQPFGVAFSPDGMLAYVANQVSDTVSVIDAATNTVIDSIFTGAGTSPRGVAMSPDGTVVYVTNSNAGSVAVIDTVTRSVVATVSVGALPSGLAVSPDGTVVYVANQLSDSISVIDTSTNTVTSTIPVGAFPTAVAFHPDGTRAYVTNSNDATVSVIDTATQTVVATIGGFSGPHWIAVSPDGNTAYVSNFGNDTVAVLDTASNSITTTIAAGQVPFGIAISGDGLLAFVANQASSTVSVIDTTTNTVVSTIAVGSQPIGVAVGPSAGQLYVTDVAGNSVTVIAPPTISISTTRQQFYGGAVAIPVGTTLTALNVTFGSTVDGNGSLIVNSQDFNSTAPIGGTTPLAAVTVSGTSQIRLGNNITTVGPQQYGSPGIGWPTLFMNGTFTTANESFRQLSGCQTVLTGDVTINTGTGAIGFAITNGQTAGGEALTLITTGTTAVGTLGRFTPLASVNITGGTASLGGVHTTGPQTYGGDVILRRYSQGGTIGQYVTDNATFSVAGNATLDSGITACLATGSGTIAFNGTIDGPACLSLASTGQTFLNGTIGGTTPLVDLTTAAGSNVTLDGDVTTTGNQTFLGDLTLASNATLTAGTPDNGSGGNGSNGSNGSNGTGTSGSILFAGSLAPVGLTQTLSLNATTNITLPEIGRTTAPFAEVDALANLTLLTGDITTIADQTYRGRAVATQDLEIVACLGTITFGGGLDSINTSLTPNVSIQTAGNVVFSAPVGGTATGELFHSTAWLGALNVAAGSITLAGLGSASAVSSVGATSANLTVTDSACGTLNFTGLFYAVSGDARYTAGSTYGYQFTSPTAGRAVVRTVSGDLEFLNGDISLAANVSLEATANSGGRLLVNGDIDGVSGEDVSLSAFSDAVVINGTIGSGTGTIGNVSISGGDSLRQPVLLQGDIFGGFAPTNSVFINGNIALSGDRGIVTAGDISISGPIDADPTNGGALQLLTASNVTLTQAIGQNDRLSNLSIFANVTSLGGSAILTAGPQTYATNLTLAADIAIDTANNDVAFQGTIDGARQLGITAGTGNVTFFRALGRTTPLQGLNLASAAAVEALSTIAIDGTGGSSHGLQIGADVNNVNLSQPGSTIANAALSGISLAGGSTDSTLGGFTVTGSGGVGVDFQEGGYFGTTFGNSTVTGSGSHGILVTNVVGLTIRETRSSGNARSGIAVFENFTKSAKAPVTIQDSIIGLDASGTAAQPNLGQGLILSGTDFATVSNTTVGGNGQYGIVVTGGATDTTITGNRIGLGTDGTTAIGNGQSGVFVLGGATGTTIVGNQIRNNNGMAGIQVVDGTSNTTIGGSGSLSNLLVNNGLFGITVSGNVPGTRVLGNLLSIHSTANLYLNNAQNLTVGSTTAGEANRFDFAADYGVYAGGDLTGTTIQGNIFRRHTLGGIALTNASNLTVRGNTLDDNGAFGLYGTGDLTGTTLQGNTISNHTVGVQVDNGANLTIGSATGTATSDPDANTITKNSYAGVVVSGTGSQNVSILSNSIFENDFIGISLSAGGNALARTPTLTAASTTAVSGSITGTDGDVYRIQYFKSADDVTSSSRFAQGEQLIAWQDVTIVGGTASIDEDISGGGVIVTDWVTATATLLVGGLPSETSQFSFGIRVTA